MMEKMSLLQGKLRRGPRPGRAAPAGRRFTRRPSALGPSGRASLARHYAAASLLVLTGSLLVLGWWVGTQIQQGVVHRTAATTALYVENFVVMQVQELRRAEQLTPEHIGAIERLLASTSQGREIVSIKIWGPGGRVVYGEHAGEVFAVKGEQSRAWQGEVVSHLTVPEDDENEDLRPRYPHLIETYAPIRLENSDQVLAVAEFYQDARQLDAEVRAAQARSWVVVTLVMLVTYLILSGLVRRGSQTIDRQDAELRVQVRRLETLLAHNRDLHGRVQRAASRTVAMNEQFLRRVASDLHDGPAQELSHALLRLDTLTHGLPEGQLRDVGAIEQALRAALSEMRTLAKDLRLPELDPLTLPEVVARAVRDHQRRTGTPVELNAELNAEPGGAGPGDPTAPDVPLSVKMAAFRIVQEGLNNAFRHAGGREQRVRLALGAHDAVLDISDGGQGLSWSGEAVPDRLGLSGMRERAESLGGTFTVSVRAGGGTLLRARLPLRPDDAHA